MIEKAVIVAAGLSSRLYPTTLERPKGLLEIGNQTILDRSINLLHSYGIKDIAVVVGYKGDVIRKSIGDKVSYINNPFYKECNNMGSLWFAKNFVGNSPFVYMHGDIVYDGNILSNMLESKIMSEVNMVTDYGPADDEAMKVKTDGANYLIESDKELKSFETAGEWTGIACINNSNKLFNTIENILMNDGLTKYDTFAFTEMAATGSKIYCSSTEKLPWIEIDFLEDYKRAEDMFDGE